MTRELPPINPIGTPETRMGPDGLTFPAVDATRPWDSLSDDEKRLFSRMAEVYAGFLAHVDAEIGRLLTYLDETGQLDNTVIVLVSDNGASGEGGPNGSVNENKLFNGIPDDIEANLAMLDDPRERKDLQPLPKRLGDGVQHAVQAVEALRLQRRNHRPVHHLLAEEGDQRDRRDPPPIPPRDRHRPDDPRLPRSSAPGDDQGPRPERVRRRQHALQLRRRGRPRPPEDAVLFDAGLTGDLARGLEGRQYPPDDERLEPLQRRPLESTATSIRIEQNYTT